jgi:hypothetical protein
MGTNTHLIMDRINKERMSEIERTKKRIEALQSLLTMSVRMGEPAYTRSLRKDIEGLERELKILKVKGSPTYNHD